VRAHRLFDNNDRLGQQDRSLIFGLPLEVEEADLQLVVEPASLALMDPLWKS
jgi:hypothetical protein